MGKWYVLEMSDGAAEKIVASKRHPAAKRGAAFSESWAMAKDVSGYNETSPIWGKTRYEVYDRIEDLYIEALTALKTGDKVKFTSANDEIIALKAELAKRSAAQEVARAARKA